MQHHAVERTLEVRTSAFLSRSDISLSRDLDTTFSAILILLLLPAYKATSRVWTMKNILLLFLKYTFSFKAECVMY